MTVYLQEQESWERMKGVKPINDIASEEEGPEESLATTIEKSSEPPPATPTCNASCAQPQEAVEGLLDAHGETQSPPPSSHDCSPLHDFLCEVLGATLMDIIQDNARGIRPQNSCSHLEACQEVGWKWGSKISDRVMREDETTDNDDDDRLIDEEVDELVRQISLRFEVTGNQGAMAPKIPERRTSKDDTAAPDDGPIAMAPPIPPRNTCRDKERDLDAMSPPRIPKRRASHEDKEVVPAGPFQ
jgi:hypothetical protein